MARIHESGRTLVPGLNLDLVYFLHWSVFRKQVLVPVCLGGQKLDRFREFGPETWGRTLVEKSLVGWSHTARWIYIYHLIIHGVLYSIRHLINRLLDLKYTFPNFENRSITNKSSAAIRPNVFSIKDTGFTRFAHIPPMTTWWQPCECPNPQCSSLIYSSKPLIFSLFPVIQASSAPYNIVALVRHRITLMVEWFATIPFTALMVRGSILFPRTLLSVFSGRSLARLDLIPFSAGVVSGIVLWNHSPDCKVKRTHVGSQLHTWHWDCGHGYRRSLIPFTSEPIMTNDG